MCIWCVCGVYNVYMCIVCVCVYGVYVVCICALCVCMCMCVVCVTYCPALAEIAWSMSGGEVDGRVKQSGLIP